MADRKLATKRPWRHKTEDGTLGSIVDAEDDPIGHTFVRLNDPRHAERQANAELIVHAVNNHDALVEAAQMALEDITGPITDSGIKIRFETRDKLIAALAAVEDVNHAK